MKKILIMGLPGAGKTHLAQHIVDHLQAEKKKVGWLNADDVRQKYNDWDFSQEGRIRQSIRMRDMAEEMTDMDYVICDFVAPLVEMRDNFKADWTIWVDTIKTGRFEDTNKIFTPPEKYNFRVTEQNAEKWSEFIAVSILNRKIKVFVNGSFDIIHAGHLQMLATAKSMGDTLMVAIDSDRRIAEKKGTERPFNKINNRYHLMCMLKPVDDVAVFDSDQELIDIVKNYEPDIMIVGSDWRGKKIIGSEYAKRVEYYERTDDESTTKTIESYIDRRQLYR